MSSYFYQDRLTRFPLLQRLSDKFDIVKEEILTHIETPMVMQDYPNYKVNDNKPIYEKYWKACPCSRFVDEHIELQGNEMVKQYIAYVVDLFRKNCPTTYSIIKPYEDNNILANAFVSRLVPGTIINPHDGWTKKYMRIHLGLVTDPQCNITVGPEQKETQTWHEGKFLAFNDGDLHSVKHNGTAERIVFSMDINLKFLDKYIDK
jgi:Aspartyl/Asparaginyl beta-hydroxylase